MLRDEQSRRDQGMPERDMSQWSQWRDGTDEVILDTLSLYGRYPLTDGFSGSVQVMAFDKVCDYEDIQKDDRADLLSRIVQVNAIYMDILKARSERERKRG